MNKERGESSEEVLSKERMEEIFPYVEGLKKKSMFEMQNGMGNVEVTQQQLLIVIHSLITDRLMAKFGVEDKVYIASKKAHGFMGKNIGE